MKKTYIMPYLWIVFVLLFSGCTQSKVHAKDKTRNPLEELAQFGFYAYAEPIDIGELKIMGLDNSHMTDRDFQGKISLLNFWASWCPPCRAEMPSIERLYQAMKGKAFKIIAVNSGERQKDVMDFTRKHSYTFPVYLDEWGTLSSIFASRGLPVTYLVNKDGKIAATRLGAMEYDQPELIKLFKELADE